MHLDLSQQCLFFTDNVCDTEFANNVTFKVVTSILNFYIPTGIITVLYVRIFLAIKRRTKDIAKFGAYTSSGLTSKCSKATVRQNKLDKEGTIINNGDPIKNNETAANNLQNLPSQKKAEFHRLAVVAFPIEKKLKITNMNQVNGGGRIGKTNFGMYLLCIFKRH